MTVTQLEFLFKLKRGSNPNLSKEFIDTILNKLRDGPVGKLAKSEKYILYLGQKFFNIRRYKRKKIRNVRKTTLTEMRLLASLWNIQGFGWYKSNRW